MPPGGGMIPYKNKDALDGRLYSMFYKTSLFRQHRYLPADRFFERDQGLGSHDARYHLELIRKDFTQMLIITGINFDE